LGPGGRRFESCHPDKEKPDFQNQAFLFNNGASSSIAN
jgi:hypothetical protein